MFKKYSKSYFIEHTTGAMVNSNLRNAEQNHFEQVFIHFIMD
jgi:hypothetical protein